MAKGSLSAGKKVYLAAGRRTPFGKFGGSLAKIAPVDLAVVSSKAAFEDAKIAASEVDHVIFANVIPSTTDTLYGARHLGLKLGMPKETPGYSVNRLCGSGIQAILDAARLIKLGEAEIVLAAGAENMSLAPQLIYGARFGTKYGELKTVDMLTDTLRDKFIDAPMGVTAENLARSSNISRMEADAFSLNSHAKTANAYRNGWLQGEIAPVELGKGSLDRDEHARFDGTLEQMQKLRPSFQEDGVVTPGTASGIVDGACSVVVVSEEIAAQRGISPLAEIVDGHVVGVDPAVMGIGPVPAIRGLLEKNQLKVEDIDLFEINEAFAAQALACSRDLGVDEERLNPWGGAVAIGHPLGATGTRIALVLARQLRQQTARYGVASACIGGGQGIALLLKRI